VELEQAYIDFTLNGGRSARTGLFIVPVGIINETHEPPTFYGVERNAVENTIIPSSWWEAGAALSGSFANLLPVSTGLSVQCSGGATSSLQRPVQCCSSATPVS
jgi:hypothetical protein